MDRVRRMTIMRGAATAALMACGARPKAQPRKYRIGISSLGLSAEYQARWVSEIRAHPAVAAGRVVLTVYDGKFDPLVQSNQMDTMITQRFDAIVYSPLDFSGGGAAVDRAAAAGIPVVGACALSKTQRLSAFIGTDDVEGGRMIAKAIVEKLNGKGRIVILEGPIGQSPQLLRRKGIDEVLKQNAGITVLATRSANWSRSEGQSIMENWLLAHAGKIDGVLAENDEMGLGAIEAIKGSRTVSMASVAVIAIDGITDGVRAVKAGTMLSTLYKDARIEGQGALDLALRALVGPGFQPESDVWRSGMRWDASAISFDVPWKPITASNVTMFSKA